MSSLDTLRLVLMSALDLVNDAGMRDAQIARLAATTGISLEIPEKPEAEVTQEIRAYILAAREQYSEAEWLCSRGPRDQICVQFHLSRQQITGVLAGQTKRQSSNGSIQTATATEDSTHVASKTVAQQVSPITADPSTWPRYNGGGRPTRMKRQLDAVDWDIAQAVLQANQWDKLRDKIGSIRSLSSQQVAGMKAVFSRGTSPHALREVE